MLEGPRRILVEGESDRIALETLSRRLGLDPPDLVVLGGAHAVARYVASAPEGVQLVALCDRNEQWIFRRVLNDVFVCDPDLEGELIRALGTDRVLGLLAGESFPVLQKQPAWRGMPLEDQLRRFLSGRSGNKHRYAEVFVEALDLDHVPPPLVAVLNR